MPIPENLPMCFGRSFSPIRRKIRTPRFRKFRREYSNPGCCKEGHPSQNVTVQLDFLSLDAP